MKTLLGTAAAALTLTAGFAFADGAVTDGLKVAPQKLGHSVVVETVTAAQDGWVVIHKIDHGKPVVPTSIGHTYVKAGTTEHVYVALSEAVEGHKVIAMLHSDDGHLGVYQFGADSTEFDKPVAVDGNVVVAPIAIE